ncbi:hypothetical protein BDN70DRAFT_887201 [Pholiota conissans]|uniref:Uncharacterized protein n=1 Tax=Pholiota conissans TaxID=109636 RepID=A0A9P5YNT1_9AGAR|nr:hypothetical protein BDN70DRAFT_887201 [Pholiota conissans]
MHRVSARSHLRYLYALFRHGCSQQRPEASAKYLFRCMDTVRGRCARTLGTVTREEYDLRELLSHLATIARTTGGYWPDVVDRRLDLDDALMASVCDQDEAISSGPSTVSSTSSVSSAGSSKIVEMPELQHPRPVYGWQRFMQS